MPTPDNADVRTRTGESPHAAKSRTGQSPDEPIEFEADNEVARGNEERANAEPEPPALHDAEVPCVPDDRGQKT